MKKLLSLAFAIVFAVSMLALVACDNDKNHTVADNTEYYDAITKKCKLTKEYTGKSFLTEGIGEATLDALTDGDTTRFILKKGGETIVVRYFCIDTPESTGSVEKWGKAASLFVKSKLSVATSIVLEASATPAENDSYGSRYLGYVWYKTATDTDYKLLNLEIVENGFSENKALNTSKYAYYEYFKEANEFAKSISLRIYSKKEDPLFNDDPVEMTIKDFWINTEAYYSEENDVGSQVVFEAVLTEVFVSTTGTYTFTAVQYDPTTGETFSMRVYAAYASSSGSRLPIGHLLTIKGGIQKFSGQFQVSGVAYNAIMPGDKDCTIKQRNYYLTFSNTVTYSSDYYASTLYSDVTVVSATADGSNLVIVGTANQRTANGTKADAVTFTFTVAGAASHASEFAAGSTFRVGGFQTVSDSHNIAVPSYDNITK